MKDTFILIMGCFDTKGEVFAYLIDCIVKQGEQVLLMDTGVMDTSPFVKPHIQAGEVAEAAGHTLEDLRSRGDRGHAVEAMGKGAARLVARLVADGGLKAAISMGGGGGTYIALTAFREIPLGIPKLCVSTVASKDLSQLVGHKDITLMASVVDVAGRNSIIDPLIAQAAEAIGAMARSRIESGAGIRGRVAISMFGNTTACVNFCTELLKEEGYEVMAFHANGVGGQTMEALIREGCFVGVLDVTTTELADDLCNGVCSAGNERLTAAADSGVPQVVVPGCLDMVNFAQPDTVPDRYRDRNLYSWAPNVTLMRTNEVENRELGKRFSLKLNQSTAPVRVLLPRKGISQIDAEGGVFYDPALDQALFSAIRMHAAGPVEVIEMDAHVNDKAFAEALVTNLLDVIRIKETGQRTNLYSI